jgi:hypothetical protein
MPWEYQHTTHIIDPESREDKYMYLTTYCNTMRRADTNRCAIFFVDEGAFHCEQSSVVRPERHEMQPH